MARRILVVDDCADTVESLSALLQIYGYDCRGVQTGGAALEEARWFEPEVVLLDLVLPDMDGISVARRLRDSARHRCFIAALTGMGRATDRARTLAAGFDAHLLKPIDAGRLREVVARGALAHAV